MTDTTANLPPIVSRDAWRAARAALLAKEKELTRARDALSAERRRMPIVAVEHDYRFEGPDGSADLLDLFAGHRQLIVYHFMFDPAWEAGCPSCSLVVDHLGPLAHLHARDTTLALVSRAPYATIAPFRARMGWAIPWYSSAGSTFNYDFHVSFDDAHTPAEYNYRDVAGLNGEGHGVSVFLRDGARVYHTYSTYARGPEVLIGTYQLLDLTPLGRQETWEDSPAGWPQSPAMGWLRHRDRYAHGPASPTSQEESACGTC